jgi:hypothetical protein
MSSQMQRDIHQMQAELLRLRTELESVMIQLAALGQKRPPGRPPKPK